MQICGSRLLIAVQIFANTPLVGSWRSDACRRSTEAETRLRPVNGGGEMPRSLPNRDRNGADDAAASLPYLQVPPMKATQRPEFAVAPAAGARWRNGKTEACLGVESLRFPDEELDEGAPSAVGGRVRRRVTRVPSALEDRKHHRVLQPDQRVPHRGQAQPPRRVHGEEWMGGGNWKGKECALSARVVSPQAHKSTRLWWKWFEWQKGPRQRPVYLRGTSVKRKSNGSMV